MQIKLFVIRIGERPDIRTAPLVFAHEEVLHLGHIRNIVFDPHQPVVVPAILYIDHVEPGCAHVPLSHGPVLCAIAGGISTMSGRRDDDVLVVAGLLGLRVFLRDIPHVQRFGHAIVVPGIH